MIWRHLRFTRCWRPRCLAFGSSFFQGTSNVTTNRSPLLWYRGSKRAAVLRQAIEVVLFIGAAALASYLVLQPR